eukprot:TRINITY_DN22721_c0_g1_i1.p1 TRINITY_DN22721_c0_g1~~TRINITY_DN22721_c0_g1_i1.p1  ORF type:complete len:483 (-),score=150.00 TRINITY_DN22721_c0_g1_i1:208-1656(-)
MLRSLVGSEMCIRDRASTDEARKNALEWIGRNWDTGHPQMMMVHSMKLNHSLQLGEVQYQDPYTRGMNDQVQAQMKKAHWALFNQKLEQGDTSQLCAEIDALKKMLLELNPSELHRSKLQDQLDPTLICQMIEHNAINAEQIGNIVAFLVDEVKDYDMPANDEKNDEFRAQMAGSLSCEGDVDIPKLLPEVIAWVSDKLSQIKLDKANFLLKWLQPIVEQQGAELERDFMNDAIAKGEIELSKTQCWIAANASDGDAADAAVRLAQRRGVMELLRSEVGACVRPDFPESLILDRQGMQGLQNNLQLVALTAACLLEVKTAVEDPKQGMGFWPVGPEHMKQMRDAVMQALTSPIQMAAVRMVAQQFAMLCLQAADEADKSVLVEEDKFVAMIEKRASAIANTENAVVPLLKKRLEDCVASALVNVEDVDMGKVLAENPFAAKCFGMFQVEIVKIYQMADAICNLNFVVFYPRYRDMLAGKCSE